MRPYFTRDTLRPSAGTRGAATARLFRAGSVAGSYRALCQEPRSSTRTRGGPHHGRLAPMAWSGDRWRALFQPSRLALHRSLGRWLRHRTLPPALHRDRCTTAGVARTPVEYGPLELLALASAPSLPGLRPFSRRITVVCGAATLRQYGRIRCPHVLLLLALAGSGKRDLARRTGGGCGLGRVRGHLHCNRGGSHALRSTRSRALELAAHRAAGHIPGHRGRSPVLDDCAGADGARLFCSMSPRCGGRLAP